MITGSKKWDVFLFLVLVVVWKSVFNLWCFGEWW